MPTRKRGIRQYRAPDGAGLETFQVRAPAELLDALAEEADARGVSMNLLAIDLLTAGLDRHTEKEKTT